MLNQTFCITFIVFKMQIYEYIFFKLSKIEGGTIPPEKNRGGTRPPPPPSPRDRRLWHGDTFILKKGHNIQTPRKLSEFQ